MNDPGLTPSSENRIIITYQEATSAEDYPTLEVRDTGTGMDNWIINRWFLKVGRSFYGSTEFNQFRVQLRNQGLDFAPTSEFGVGFLSAFLLADKVEVETAMWEPLREDTRRRVLEIHGPTRLIRLSEDENTGAARFRGTRVKLILKRGIMGDGTPFPRWHDVRAYLKGICVRLPYRLKLRHVTAAGAEEESIDPGPLKLELSGPDAKNAVRIPVDDTEAGIKGEIAILHPGRARALDRAAAQASAARVVEAELRTGRVRNEGTCLIRAGFRVGAVPGLPETYLTRSGARAIISLNWEGRRERRYPLTNLSRTSLVEEPKIERSIIRSWLSWLLEHVDELPKGFMHTFDFPRGFSATDAIWMERFNAYDVYRLAANGWHSALNDHGFKGNRIKLWEESSGEPLPRCNIVNWEFHVVLQDIVLPKVCRLLMGPQASFYLSSPEQGWREILKAWREYIRKPIGWGNFVAYVGRIENLLYYEYPRSDYLNAKYQSRVQAAFCEREIPQLTECLRELADSKKERQIELSGERLSLLRRAQEQIGDLEIAELSQVWRLDSFRLPKM